MKVTTPKVDVRAHEDKNRVARNSCEKSSQKFLLPETDEVSRCAIDDVKSENISPK